jgi:hypothetical protein
MKANPSLGVVALSIYSSGEQEQDFSRSKQLVENCRWLLHLLDERRFPATWFMSVVVAPSVRPSILSSNVPHEVGVSIDRNQLASRAAFGREIDRQVLVAGNDGIKVTSLALPSGPIQQLDMLIRRGISALCPLELDAISRSNKAISWQNLESPRFGTWNLPATFTIGGGGWFAQTMSRMHAKRQIQQVASESKFCHLVVPLDQVNRAPVRRTLRAAIALAAILRDHGKLETQPLGRVVDRLTIRPVAKRAHSILRVA